MPIENLFGLAPSGVYRATNRYRTRGALLPHPFTLTCEPEGTIGGILSVALAVSSRYPGVTWHSALWSPDFPPLTNKQLAAIARTSPPARILAKLVRSSQLTLYALMLIDTAGSFYNPSTSQPSPPLA